ncbi:thiopeptide-type bacteriocin biosynthesis protein [Streptomyces sp. NPDC002755]|uniref:thiopeptide-type bacteriocin biosynthesis protein n=1 Tax=Streptomyces sp. NPDC002884 TaxID=3154544 RepID=UPI00331654F6
MSQYNSSPGEDAVLAVLGGTPLDEAARQVPTSPLHLAEAIERYRAAGRAALGPPPTGWYQARVSFADYPSAAATFRANLLPTLQSTSVGSWWFVRKYPYWRLRVRPRSDGSLETAVEQMAQALDSALSRGAIKEWRASLYEPEIIAFGGLEAMAITEQIFYIDSVGVLTYDQLSAEQSRELLDAKVTSLCVLTLLLRAAGLEWSEQGDVWGQVETKRELPADVPPNKVSAMADTMRALVSFDRASALANGPLAPLTDWADGMEQGGRSLKAASEANRLGLGLRSVLARHVIFHWNRMGFSTRQQAIWSRAAREALLGR